MVREVKIGNLLIVVVVGVIFFYDFYFMFVIWYRNVFISSYSYVWFWVLEYVWDLVVEWFFVFEVMLELRCCNDMLVEDFRYNVDYNEIFFEIYCCFVFELNCVFLCCDCIFGSYFWFDCSLCCILSLVLLRR